ncbi:MAG: ribosome assembly cofactor RimP [Bacteroidota bacterium]
MLAADVEQKIVETIAEVNPDAFIVDIEFKKGSKSVLNIKVDKDSGISLAECAKISRKLGRVLEEEEGWDFSYLLQVSSPGVGFPLKLLRQYKNNVGRSLQIVTLEGSTVRGTLQEMNEEYLLLGPLPEKNRKSKGKKKKVHPAALTQEKKILFSEIKEAKVIIV